MRFLKIACTYSAWAFVAVVLFPFLLMLSFVLGKKRYDSRLYATVASWVGRLLLRVSFVSVKIEGLENMPSYPHSPAIVIANHASALDILILEKVAGPYPHIWLSKSEYGRLPIMGALLRRMHVLVDRYNPRKAAAALMQACKLAQGGARHLLLFPEGARSESGELQEFNEGFVILARKLNRGVIPVNIRDAHVAMPKKSVVVSSQMPPITVILGKPLMISPDETNAQFLSRVQEWFKQTTQDSSKNSGRL
jgi:1-acyl-sn-glycerol-3-phosphate acyltransferase